MQARFGQMEAGKFSVGPAPAGSYTLHVRANDNQGISYDAEEKVNIAGKDLNGLQLALQPPISIAVHVNAAPDAGSPTQSGALYTPAGGGGAIVVGSVNGIGSQVQLVRTDSTNGERFYASPQPGSDPQNLTVSNVTPGTYAVSAQAFGSQCVDSIFSGSVDLTRNDLVVAPGSSPQPIIVSLRNDCATLTATIRSEGENPSGALLLISDSPHSDPKVLPFQANGDMSVGGLTPGDYHLYALSTLDGLEYANPEALRSVPSQSIHLAAKEQGHLTITSIFERRN